MVDGVVYTTAGTRRAVVALDAGTGEMLWMHSENEGKRGDAAPRQLSGRGLAYWTDGREHDASSTSRPATAWSRSTRKPGIPAADFGKNGVVDLKKEDDQTIDPITGEIGLHATPIIAKDVIVVGAAHLAGRRARRAKPTRRATSAGTTPGPASACGSSTPFRRPASSATTPGKRIHGHTPVTPASGRR